MTNAELHKILDDNDKKLSIKEFEKVIYELKEDCCYSSYKSTISSDTYHMGFYSGEVNAFYIVLDLLEHVDLEKRDING